MTKGKTILAIVLYNGTPSGILKKEKGLYRFTYNEAYMNTTGSRSISITMPFRREAFESRELFPVFVNMLSEGKNKQMQCRMLKIDEKDYFSLLLATTKEDNIGPITIKEINEPS